MPESDKMTVWVTGLYNRIRSGLIQAVRQCDFASVSETEPYSIIQVFEDRTEIFHASGKRMAIVPNGKNSVENLMRRLESEYIVRELAAIENPKAPFSVEMWMDSPGKHRFSANDRVTLYYRVNRIPGNRSAFFTLVNVAPDGLVSILYPGKADLYTGPGGRRFINAPVEAGKIHSIPKKADFAQRKT